MYKKLYNMDWSVHFYVSIFFTDLSIATHLCKWCFLSLFVRTITDGHAL